MGQYIGPHLQGPRNPRRMPVLLQSAVYIVKLQYQRYPTFHSLLLLRISAPLRNFCFAIFGLPKDSVESIILWIATGRIIVCYCKNINVIECSLVPLEQNRSWLQRRQAVQSFVEYEVTPEVNSLRNPSVFENMHL